ncbi:unnamed protein product [Prorocentrum cordatum]|nr:unnamed protein product [Polarella glacialis]
MIIATMQHGCPAIIGGPRGCRLARHPWRSWQMAYRQRGIAPEELRADIARTSSACNCKRG